MKRRIFNLLIAFDQFLFCVVCLGDSNPDETASSAAYRLEQQGQWAGKLFRPIIDWIFFFQPQHCRRAYEEELTRKQSFSGMGL